MALRFVENEGYHWKCVATSQAIVRKLAYHFREPTGQPKSKVIADSEPPRSSSHQCSIAIIGLSRTVQPQLTYPRQTDGTLTIPTHDLSAMRRQKISRNKCHLLIFEQFDSFLDIGRHNSVSIPWTEHSKQQPAVRSGKVYSLNIHQSVKIKLC